MGAVLLFTRTDVILPRQDPIPNAGLCRLSPAHTAEPAHIGAEPVGFSFDVLAFGELVEVECYLLFKLFGAVHNRSPFQLSVYPRRGSCGRCAARLSPLA